MILKFTIGNGENIISALNLKQNFTIGKKCLKYIEFTDEEIKKFHRIISNNIRRIRKEKNITQLDLALSIGHKSMSTIGKIEAGLENKHYNIEQLYKIAKALDVNICDFFSSSNSKENNL